MFRLSFSLSYSRFLLPSSSSVAVFAVSFSAARPGHTHTHTRLVCRCLDIITKKKTTTRLGRALICFVDVCCIRISPRDIFAAVCVRSIDLRDNSFCTLNWIPLQHLRLPLTSFTSYTPQPPSTPPPPALRIKVFSLSDQVTFSLSLVCVCVSKCNWNSKRFHIKSKVCWKLISWFKSSLEEIIDPKNSLWSIQLGSNTRNNPIQSINQSKWTNPTTMSRRFCSTRWMNRKEIEIVCWGDFCFSCWPSVPFSFFWFFSIRWEEEKRTQPVKKKELPVFVDLPSKMSTVRRRRRWSTLRNRPKWTTTAAICSMVRRS